MSGEPASAAGEVHLDSESVEAIARRLADLLGGGVEDERPRKQLLSAEEVSRWWGVSRRWVYDHAERLSARRLGTGSRPRLRFDPDDVAEQLGEPRGRPDAQRLPAISGDCRTDSLSPRTRAMVDRQGHKAAGRALHRPPARRRRRPSAR